MSQNVFVPACVLGLALASCGARSQGTDASPSAPAPPVSPRASATASVLQPDALDAPAPVAAAEAERAARVIGEMHHMDHGSYSHVDAGRAKPASPSPRPSPAPAHHHQ
jgi:hypothetical protein